MKLEIRNKRFSGYVILPEFLNLLQVRAFEDSLGDPNDEIDENMRNKRVWVSVADEKRLPVILQIVKEWHITGVPENPTIDNFPMTPISDSHALISEIYAGIYKLWIGESLVPNE
jgi:hypothetical protein